MKNTRRIFIDLLSIIFVASIISACKKEDTSILNTNWRTIYQNNDLYLYSIKFLDNDHGFVMAESSGLHGVSDWKFILITEDGGNTWNQTTCSTNDTINQFPLYDIGIIYPISKNVLLATGYQVHKSIDKGKTWINVSPQLVGSSIEDLYVIDSLTWVIAKGTEIYRTKNAGQTWQNVFHTDFIGALESFSFSSSAIGYINDGVVDMDHNQSAGLIVKTIDGGQSWTILKPEPWKSNGAILPYVVAMQFNNDLEGYLSILGDSKLFKTLDGGNTWDVINNNHYTNGLQYFITDQIGYSSNGTTIYSTKDGGKSWNINYFNNAPNSDILTWTFLDSGQGYALTRDHRIIKKIK